MLASKIHPLTQPTSAFQLHRVAVGAQCSEPKCSRAGRYAIQIAGWFVERDGLLGGKVAICKPCGEAQRSIWLELTGEKHGAETLAAINALGGSRSVRVHAIWALRDLGYSADQVTSALAAVAEQEPVEEILELLGGAERVGAVAA